MLLLALACATAPDATAPAEDSFVAPDGLVATSGPTPTFSGPDVISGTEDFSCRVGRAGDVNGDGYNDLLVVNCDTDQVSVFLGSAWGIYSSPQVTLAGSGSDDFGASIGGDGDVNGDGYDDLVVGAPAANGNRGCVYVYLGSSGGIASSPVASRCGAVGAKLGGNVAIVGDINADGRDDVGAAPAWGGGVRLQVYYGTAGGIAGGPSTGATLPANFQSQTGEGLRPAGDVNGDGYADLVIGGSGVGQAGSIRVYYGSAAGLSLSYTHYSFPAFLGTGLNFGTSVAGAGDVNGDGYDDVIAGAPAADDMWYTGEALVLYGSAAGMVSAGADHLVGDVGADAGVTQVGISVDGGGDYNEDGLADVITGSPGRWNGGYGIPAGYWGAIQVFNGDPANVATTPTTEMFGQSFAGHSVAALGDVNGDGCDDVVMSEGEWYGWTGDGWGDGEIGWIFEANVYYGMCSTYGSGAGDPTMDPT